MAVKPEVLEFVTAKANQVVSEAKSILETVTNKSVELTFENAAEFDFEALSSDYADSVVEISFVLSSDPEGIFQIFIDKETAARIGSLMMMMEEENPEFNSDEHIDAMKETVNQILGSISTNLSEALGFSLSFNKINGEESELNEEMFSLPDLISAQISIGIEGADTKMLYSVFTSSSIESVMGDGAAEAATETAAEEAAVETAVEEEAPVEETAEVAEPAGEVGEPTDQTDLSAEELADIGDALGGDFEAGEEAAEEAADVGGDLQSMFGEEAPGEQAEMAPVEAAVPVTAPPAEEETKIEFLMDLKFPVSIELGRTKMLIKDILDLGHGSVIEFDKLANEPVDLLIDDKKIAEGEVVVIDEHFGIRITNLIHAPDFLKKKKKKAGH